MSDDELKARAEKYALDMIRARGTPHQNDLRDCYVIGALSERERWEKEVARLRERVAALENVVTWVRKQMCFCSEDDHPEHFMDGECKIYPHAEYKKALAALDATGRSGG